MNLEISLFILERLQHLFIGEFIICFCCDEPYELRTQVNVGKDRQGFHHEKVSANNSLL